MDSGEDFPTSAGQKNSLTSQVMHEADVTDQSIDTKEYPAGIGYGVHRFGVFRK